MKIPANPVEHAGITGNTHQVQSALFNNLKDKCRNKRQDDLHTHTLGPVQRRHTSLQLPWDQRTMLWNSSL